MGNYTGSLDDIYSQSTEESVIVHRRTCAIHEKEIFEEWKLHEIPNQNLSKIFVRQPKLMPLHYNELYVRRLNKTGLFQEKY